MSDSNSAGTIPTSADAHTTATADIECRIAERFDVDGYAQVTASDGSAVFRGRILNLSLTGCYIRTLASVRLPIGAPVDLIFQINGMDGPKHFSIHAETRFSKARQGLGFRFLLITPALQQALDSIITILEAAKNPRPPSSAGSIEYRLAVRYDVDGQALVTSSDGCTVFRGRILNLSLTGCFIGTIAHIRLPTGSMAEVAFQLNGMEEPVHFQVYAEARFSQPRTGVGFRFVRMTPALQLALDSIIATLETEKNQGAQKSGPAIEGEPQPYPTSPTIIS